MRLVVALVVLGLVVGTWIALPRLMVAVMRWQVTRAEYQKRKDRARKP